jgi:tetratricopeptide (TPR) repeat protein
MNRVPVTAFLAGIAILAVAVDIRVHAWGPGPATSGPAALDRAQARALDHPQECAAWADLADAYAASGDLPHAQAAFERARQLDPENRRVTDRPAWALSRWMTDEERAIVENPLSAASWGAEGVKLASQGRGVEAIPYLLEAMRLDPSDAQWPTALAGCPRDPRIDAALANLDPTMTDDEALGDRGDLFRDRGQMDVACRFWGRAAELDPADSEWSTDLATCAVQFPEYAARAEAAKAVALQNLVTAAAADPRNDEPLGDLADALFAAGRTEEACAKWARALELDPTDSEWPTSLLQCPGYTPPIPDATEAAGDDEKLGDLGDALFAVGRATEACAAWTQAAALDPSDSEWSADLLRCNGINLPDDE